jgi:pimeloyl-ACP methyl ester carboxylesterase
LPPQACGNRYIIEYIAKQSLMRVNGGWAWKFDEELPVTLKGGERHPEDYSSLSLPVGIIYGKESAAFSEQTLDYMLELMGVDIPVIGLENAQHHVFLDQPLDFVRALGAMAADLN